jgi:hypothetical protein
MRVCDFEKWGELLVLILGRVCFWSQRGTFGRFHVGGDQPKMGFTGLVEGGVHGAGRHLVFALFLSLFS